MFAVDFHGVKPGTEGRTVECEGSAIASNGGYSDPERAADARAREQARGDAYSDASVAPGLRLVLSCV